MNIRVIIRKHIEKTEARRKRARNSLRNSVALATSAAASQLSATGCEGERTHAWEGPWWFWNRGPQERPGTTAIRPDAYVGFLG